LLLGHKGKLNSFTFAAVMKLSGSNDTITDESQAAALMQHALGLATLAAGHVAPNPMVGAILWAEGRIIGQGYHQKFGGPHAEIVCLDSVKPEDRHLIPKAEMLVTLEPCAHQGKTPPCADRLIREGIPRVWIACRDPFPQVNGKGIERLQAAGIDVRLGLLEAEAKELNRRFFCYHTQHRPYIILKWAETADGFMAAPPEKELKGQQPPLVISNAWSQRILHRWRMEEAAIMVGWRTAMADNPQLTNRYWPGPSPLRVLIDRDLRVPLSCHIYHEHPSLVYNQLRSGKEGSADQVQMAAGDDFLNQVLEDLHKRGIQSVLVEGGAGLLQAFIQKGIWDEARVIRNRSLYIQQGLAAPVLPATSITSVENWENDTHSFYRNAQTIV
jgi:diaminohydroxyphosphoribosylaminopyrimidine deaminase/5-amino-6-(5-phosphoribosylamino)uracil reductase